MLRKANKVSFRTRTRRAWATRQRQQQRKGNGKLMFKLLEQMILNWLFVTCAMLMMLFVDVSHDSNGFNLTMSLKHAHNRIHWLCIATEPTGNGKPTGK
jgi:hypothetical protein